MRNIPAPRSEGSIPLKPPYPVYSTRTIILTFSLISFQRGRRGLGAGNPAHRGHRADKVQKMQRTEVPIFYRPFFCRIRHRRMVVTVTGLRAILAGYLMQAVLRNLGEGPAKRWAVKNAENRSPYLLPHIFLPDQASADGCAGNMAESDLAPIFDAGGLQELG